MAFMMVLAALIALGRVGMIWRKIPQWFYAVSCWVMTACMFLGAMKNAPAEAFWNRYVFLPIWITLFILTLVLAWPMKKRMKE